MSAGDVHDGSITKDVKVSETRGPIYNNILRFIIKLS